MPTEEGGEVGSDTMHLPCDGQLDFQRCLGVSHQLLLSLGELIHLRLVIVDQLPGEAAVHDQPEGVQGVQHWLEMDWNC